MTTMLFYEKIVPLNRDRHRKLRVRASGHKARYAAGTHYVPMAGTEFYQAARDYAVLFAGGEGDGGPIALLGMREGENLFVEDDGAWAAGTYVPAFVRRYPFILARGEGGDNFTVCIDEEFSGFGESEGDLLFDDDGKDTAFLSRTVDFLNRFAAEMERTQAFVRRLAELELLVTRNLRLTDGKGRNFLLNDFRIVDEGRLAKLSDEEVGDLHRNGWLGWIYAHLISLGNVNRLPARVADAGAAESETESTFEPPVAEGAAETDDTTRH